MRHFGGSTVFRRSYCDVTDGQKGITVEHDSLTRIAALSPMVGMV